MSVCFSPDGKSLPMTTICPCCTRFSGLRVFCQVWPQFVIACKTFSKHMEEEFMGETLQNKHTLTQAVEEGRKKVKESVSSQ